MKPDTYYARHREEVLAQKKIYYQTPAGKESTRQCTARSVALNVLWAVTLLGGRCTHPGCGQEFIPGLHQGDYRHLEFHHVIPEERLFCIMRSITSSRDVLLPELMKCVLLCRKHHQEFHNPGCTRDDDFAFNIPSIKENENESEMGKSEHTGLQGCSVPQLGIGPDPSLSCEQS